MCAILVVRGTVYDSCEARKISFRTLFAKRVSSKEGSIGDETVKLICDIHNTVNSHLGRHSYDCTANALQGMGPIRVSA